MYIQIDTWKNCILFHSKVRWLFMLRVARKWKENKKKIISNPYN